MLEQQVSADVCLGVSEKPQAHPAGAQPVSSRKGPLNDSLAGNDVKSAVDRRHGGKTAGKRELAGSSNVTGDPAPLAAVGSRRKHQRIIVVDAVFGVQRVVSTQNALARRGRNATSSLDLIEVRFALKNVPRKDIDMDAVDKHGAGFRNIAGQDPANTFRFRAAGHLDGNPVAAIIERVQK
jgi:hypothetical protein